MIEQGQEQINPDMINSGRTLAFLGIPPSLGHYCSVGLYGSWVCQGMIRLTLTKSYHNGIMMMVHGMDYEMGALWKKGIVLGMSLLHTSTCDNGQLPPITLTCSLKACGQWIVLHAI